MQKIILKNVFAVVRLFKFRKIFLKLNFRNKFIFDQVFLTSSCFIQLLELIKFIKRIHEVLKNLLEPVSIENKET
jgi:hypothetical protein